MSLGVALHKPRVFIDYFLGQLWTFKYDSFLGKGINVHVDFARVNGLMERCLRLPQRLALSLKTLIPKA